MDTECLNHRLTAAERRQFEQEGYLVVRGALPPSVVAAGAAAAERLYNEYGPASGHPAEYGHVIYNAMVVGQSNSSRNRCPCPARRAFR